MLAQLVDTLLKAGQQQADDRHKANQRIVVTPLPHGQYAVLTPDGGFEVKDPAVETVRCVDLSDLVPAVTSLVSAGQMERAYGEDCEIDDIGLLSRPAVMVGADQVTVTVWRSARRDRIKAELAESIPWSTIPQLAEPKTARELVALMRHVYRDCFRSPEVFNRFVAAFRNIEAKRKAAQRSGAAGYSQEVQAEVSLGDGAMTDWEYLTLRIPVYSHAAINRAFDVEFAVECDPDRMTFSLHPCGDACEHAHLQALEHVAAHLREGLQDDEFAKAIPVFIGHEAQGFFEIAAVK